MDNTTTFSEDEDERQERVEVEELIDAEYRELEEVHKLNFSDYNHDQFDIFPEVLKYHRKTLLKEFKVYAQEQSEDISGPHDLNLMESSMRSVFNNRKVVELDDPIGNGYRLRR